MEGVLLSVGFLLFFILFFITNKGFTLYTPNLLKPETGALYIINIQKPPKDQEQATYFPTALDNALDLVL